MQFAKNNVFPDVKSEHQTCHATNIPVYLRSDLGVLVGFTGKSCIIMEVFMLKAEKKGVAPSEACGRKREVCGRIPKFHCARGIR